MGKFGNGTQCLLECDTNLAKLPKLSPCAPLACPTSVGYYSKSGLVRNWLVRNPALAFWGRRGIYIEKITFMRLYTAHIKKLASAARPI